MFVQNVELDHIFLDSVNSWKLRSKRVIKLIYHLESTYSQIGIQFVQCAAINGQTTGTLHLEVKEETEEGISKPVHGELNKYASLFSTLKPFKDPGQMTRHPHECI